jgi:lipopolysaccharide export system protein LptA
MHPKPGPFLFTVLCALVGAQVHALPSDIEQEIRIEAERATLDQKQGITTYSGDVQFSQGSMSINADTVIFHFNTETQKIDKIHATGSPVLYQLQPTEDKGLMRIEATEVTATFDGNPQRRISTINARGVPALYQQQPTPDKGIISARAQSITYTPSSQSLALEEHASLEQDGASMSGTRIVYDLNKEVMQAAGGESEDRKRIEIIIPPQTIQEN